MDFKAEFDKLDLKGAALVGLLLAGLYYMFFFNSGKTIDAEIVRLRQSIDSNRANLDRVKKAIDDKELYGAEIKEINRNMKDFLAYFTPQMGPSEVSSQVTKRAEKFKVTVNNLKPLSKDSEFEGYIESGVHFEVEGDFNQIMAFLASITEMKRALDFSEMKFSTKTTQGESVVVLETTLIIYSSKENGGNDV